jgi:hypothetical protein
MVDADGTLLSGTSNVTSVWNGTDQRYVITIDGETVDSSDYIVLVTPVGSLETVATTDALGGDLLVNMFGTGGAPGQTRFQFVMYKP